MSINTKNLTLTCEVKYEMLIENRTKESKDEMKLKL